MLILENKIIKYKNINILKEKTNKNFNLYSLINNKNELLNDVQFRKLKDCKNFINLILEEMKENEL